MTQIAELVAIWMFFRMRFRKYSMSVWLSLQLNSDQGITLYANLYHCDLPLALHQHYPGWLSPKIVGMFSDYAELCFKVFRDRVKNWLPSTRQGSPPFWCMTMASMCRGGALSGLQQVTDRTVHCHTRYHPYACRGDAAVLREVSASPKEEDWDSLGFCVVRTSE